MKNNYYYLFELAEQVKKAFFQPEFRYELAISTKHKEEKKGIYLDKWRLSICQNGQLVPVAEPVEICLYLNEIEEILRPDIYALMERF